MSVGRAKEVEDLLKKINEQILNFTSSDSEKAKEAIVDLSEIITVGLSLQEEDLCISLLFNYGGIVEFCKAVACDNRFISAKKEALDLFNQLFEKKYSLVLKYGNQLERLSRQLYNANDSSKVRCSALNLFCTVLSKASHELSFEDFDFNRFVDQLCMDIQRNKGSLVLYQQLVTLGVLCNCCPEKAELKANLILKILKEQLIKKTGRQPDLTVAAGAVKGLCYYINNFPQGLEDNSTIYSDLYPHIHKLLNPELNLPKREAQRAALELIFTHGAKFSEHLFKNHEILFKWLLAWCRHNNRDDHKAGVKAMDTFVVVIANVLELQDDDNGQGIQVFKFLLKEFNELIERSRSTVHISLAVKGYGLLSGACKMYLTPDDVFKMFARVLAVSHHGFFQSSEMLETKVANLPSYVESLGFIISKLDNVTIGMVESILQLAVALVENFSYVSQFKVFLAYRAFFTLFASLREHSEIYSLFMHNFVYHFIVHCCSFEPIIENEMVESGTLESSEHEEKWTSSSGLKGKRESFKDYLPLWRAFLIPEKVGDIKVSGRPVSSLTKICFHMYEEFLVCILEISEKLDLTTYKQGDKEKVENSLTKNEEANSDPVKGLKAKTPKDFQVYMNLFCLMEAVIPLQSQISLEYHLERLFVYYIKRSSLEPLVSTHYSIITLFLCLSDQIGFFKTDSKVAETTRHLITSYVIEVLKRCKQFKNNLLSCSLSLILRVPINIVDGIIPELVSPLQISLQMGLSFLPIARICVSALKLWNQYLKNESIQSLFPEVLPYLLPYLRSKESLSESEMQTRVITVRMALATQRRKINKKLFEERKRIEDSAMRKIQFEILDLLGHLDQKLCLSLVTSQSENVFKRSIVWDTHKHVLFSMPFQQLKLEIYFDEILPETIDKALNSSDRQTKVASCELLHSLIILMIGKGHQQSEKTQLKIPMTALYLRVFEAILKLSCDADNVTRQLFLTLTFQIIHWFTNNKSFEHPDTAALLQVIMDGIVTPNDPSLRDLSAECLLEFMKWSRKQSRSPDQSKLNIKSVLKRIISLCNHPSAYKRLGGCLAWNSIYTEVREDEKACDEWMVLLLATFLSSLNCCEDDDDLIGTKDQCQSAIDHIERIFIVRSKIFNKATSIRRIPSEMIKGDLPEILVWLLKKISSSNPYVRHTSMKLIGSLASVTQGYKSGNDFIQQIMHREKLNFLLEIITNPLRDESLSRQDYCQSSYKDICCRIQNLLGALDSFLWISSKHVFEVDLIFSKSCENILFEIKSFTSEIGLKTSNEILDKNLSEHRTILCNTSQLEKLNQLRCSNIIRIIDLNYIILENKKSSSTDLSLLDENVKKIILSCIFDPDVVGFNVRDSQVSTQLQQRVADLLLVMLKKLPQTSVEDFKREIYQYINDNVLEGFKNLPENLDPKTHIPLKTVNNVKGMETLRISGWIGDGSTALLISEEVFTYLNKVLFSSREGIDYTKEISSKHFSFLEEYLKLGVCLNDKLLNKLFREFTSKNVVVGSDGKEIKKGTHILSVLGDVPLILLVHDPCFCIEHIAEIISAGQVTEGLDILTRIMKLLMKNSKLRSRYSSKLVEKLLDHWEVIFEASFKSDETKGSFLTLIMASFMADKEGIMSSVLKKGNQSGKALFSFYHQYLCDSNINLGSKANALKLLPFFVSVPGGESIIKNTLQNFRMSFLPLKFSEFELGSHREKELKNIATAFLNSLELNTDVLLFEFIIRLFCCDESRRYEDELQTSLRNIMRVTTVTKQIETLKFLFETMKNLGNQVMRLEVLERVFLPCLHHSSLVAAESFFSDCICDVVSSLNLIVQGRSDEQLKTILTKYMAFSLIQILYSKLPKEKLSTPGSVMNSAYDAKDTTGKELTKEILKRSVRTAKGELRHDLTHQELRRKCSCAAFNSLISVLTNVQDQLKFYHNFIFSENPAKDEAIFEGLINIDKVFEFDIEVKFDPGKKNRFVTVRSKNKETSSGGLDRNEGTVQYLASHYLLDSSLKEDLSQYDFSSSVVLNQAANTSFKRENLNEGEMIVMKLDQSDFNDHEVMPNLIAVIRHMVDTKIMQLYSNSELPGMSDLPQWMLFLKSKLESTSTKANIKLFILRLIINTEDVFGHYGNLFVVPILNCIVDGILGKSINYFIADLFVTILSWGEKAVPSDANLIFEVLKFLVSCSPHTRADIFKYNLNIIKVLVETWRSVLKAPSENIFILLEYENGSKREIEAGLQISGILLANKVSPYKEDSVTEQQRFTSDITSLMAKPTSVIYNAAAEVLGLYLNYNSSRDGGNELLEKVFLSLAPQISTSSRQLGQAISCVFFIHKHFPEIVSKFIGKLLAVLPKLNAFHKERVLHCLVSYSSRIEDIFAHMKEQNILNSLETKQAKTQLVSLELIKSSLPRLQASQISYFLPGVLTLQHHFAPHCRKLMYEISMWIYDKFRDIKGTDEESITEESQIILLKGTKDEDVVLRQAVKNFWIQKAKNLSVVERLLYVMENLYTNETDDCFLPMATYILLESSHSSADFWRPIFPYALTECVFKEMKISPGWRTQHLSMVPMFVNTQASQEASLETLISMTQEGNTDDDENSETSNVNLGPRATQSYAFSATQNQGLSFDNTFNWVTGSSLDSSLADNEFNISHAPYQPSSSGLYFTDSNKSHIKTRFKGVSSDEPDKGAADTPSKESRLETWLLRRRFVVNKDREKQTVHFARQEEIRRKIRTQIEVERKQKREAQVTLYRQYRVGELPDIQIPHKALISPLQALAERDDGIASQIFQLLFEAIVENSSSVLSSEEETQWRHKLFDAVRNILRGSETCYPYIARPLLQIAMTLDIDINPEEVSLVCMKNGLEPVGILLLEKQYMRLKKQERGNEPARKRARKECLSGSVQGDTTLWLKIAEMYKNLSNWDSVLGILKSEIGDLKDETIKALEAESEKCHIEAYKNYVNALKKETWSSPPSHHEQQVWEEWFITSAENLGQWEKVEEFIEGRFFSEEINPGERLQKVWQLPQSVFSFVLPSLVNSKLMKVLQGSENDGGLCNFISKARQNDKYRLILENEMGLQMSVLAINQEKFELARSLLRTSQLSLLSRFLHCSLLSSKSLMEYLKSVQALSELHDFLMLYSLSVNDDKEESIKCVIDSWRMADCESIDSITQSQFTLSFRNLYLRFLRPYFKSDTQYINKIKIMSEISMVTLSLANTNPYLAQFHLSKLEHIPKDQEFECKLNFLKTEANVMRANLKDPYGKLHYLVEAWCKYLGKVNLYLTSCPSPYIEAKYLLQESVLCLNICEAIRDLKDKWDPEDKFMKVLSEKFDNVNYTSKENWFSSLLKCGHNALLKADTLVDLDKTSCNNIEQRDIYGAIFSFYENCLGEWKEYEVDGEFTDSYIRFILKGMSSGSKNAHNSFPRLIYLLEYNTNLGTTFMKESQRVPAWMFLLWISHILIYLDKAPGQFLLPIVKVLAKIYPQAVIYPFEVSKDSYNFAGKYGLQIKKSCDEIKFILDKHSLIYNFISALSLVHLPHLELKDKLNKIAKEKDKETICRLLKEVHLILKPHKQVKNSCDEKGLVYLKQDNFLKKASAVFEKNFDQNGENLNFLSVDKLLKGGKEIYGSLNYSYREVKHLTNLNYYSPWLATFNSSNYMYEIEIPGQYRGLSKPTPEYHTKISSFNQNLLMMESLRLPMRITINGSDEKEYSFLIKYGEDLRTDQRMENLFSLMNNTFSSNCSDRLSCKPSLVTFGVIPFRVDFGILEWVEHTTPLLTFMTMFATDIEKKMFEDATIEYSRNQSWVIGSSIAKKDECIRTFEKIVNKVPWDLIRRGLFRLSANYEGFFYIRSSFTSSYATMCVSHWLLGIGDRHLTNILLNKRNGNVVGIDFGHHFETATQFLPIPELVPFRLTNQIVNVMQPLGVKGQFRETMISCLHALRKERTNIFAAVQAFVKEPTKDWLNFVSCVSGTNELGKLDDFSERKMEEFRQKLYGGNPMGIFVSAISYNNYVKKWKKNSEFKDIIIGKGTSERFKIAKSENLTVAQQIDILIDQALDPNILGRFWAGWKPFL